MASQTVIVFGPTGAVGSSAARTAAELGSKVVLAMRDTSKAIPGLDASQEKSGNFQRVTADLTKPDTISEAVTSTGAKHAFIYLAHGSADNMKATITALKTAGIKFVVFLSSFTVPADPKSVPQDEIIPYIHAQVELNLTEIFGTEGFVAVRPGYFASNTIEYKSGIVRGKPQIFRPEATIDCIVPEDIGWVSGTVLAKGVPSDGNRTPYLFGPEISTVRKVVETLAKALGKTVEIEQADEKEAYRQQVEDRHVPPPIATYIINHLKADTTGLGVLGSEINEDDLKNVEKYSGKKATTFEAWAQKNKSLFA